MSRTRASEFRLIVSAHGFDICHSFQTRWYNDQLDRENLCLPRLPLGEAFLIGNTKNVWPSFLSWLQEQGRTIPSDPLDTFTTVILTKLVHECLGTKTQIYWSHELASSSKMVSMTRVASVSGLCHLHPSSRMTIHPLYGTWHSFRAVVVPYKVDDEDGKAGDESNEAPPPLMVSPLSSEQDWQLKQAAERAFSQHSHVFTQNNEGNDEQPKTLEAFQPWIDLRDAVPVGREYRFSDDQILYHYTKDPANLERLLQRNRVD